MSWTIRISSIAFKHFKKLNKLQKERTKKSLASLSKRSNPLEDPNVRPLTGELKGFYRLRVGEFRIVFSLLPDERIIAVVNFFPRGKGY